MTLFFSIINQGPQPAFKIVSVSIFPRYSLGILLNPAMRSNAGMANRQGDVDLLFTQVSSPS